MSGVKTYLLLSSDHFRIISSARRAVPVVTGSVEVENTDMTSSGKASFIIIGGIKYTESFPDTARGRHTRYAT